ncbi:MAG TPA: SPASM domain-containing protein [Bryobacteraceae bacterium]|nr:SPASM domain-containing protein [Bryobacteraceae bacterium]
MHVARRIRVFDTGSNRHLLCNALTGEILVLSDAGLRLLDALARGEPAACDSSVVEQWKRKSILFDAPEEEERQFVELCRKSWIEFQRSAPRQYTFVVNTHCNFECGYCFEKAYDLPTRTLSIEQVDAAFAVLDRFSKNRRQTGGAQYELFGGEPLLPGSRHIVDYLLARIGDRGGKASIQTNGYHLSSFVDLIAAHRNSVSQVQVTLDGPRNIHDRRRVRKGGQPTFDQVVSGIDALTRKELPLRINVRMNVDRRNVDYLADMAAVYDEKGWTKNPHFAFVAAPVDNRCGKLSGPDALMGWHELFERVFPLSTDLGGGPFDLSVFKTASYFRYYVQAARESLAMGKHFAPEFIPKVLYCEAAGLKLFAFHPDGRIYPCPEAIGTEALAIGVYHPAFHIDRGRARRWRHQTILNRARCRTCDISTFCGGGCVLTALMANGSMSEPVCENAADVMQCYFEKIGATSG